MAGDDISTNTDSLIDVGKVIKKLGEDYLTEKEKLYKAVDDLKAGWEGDDSDTYINGVNSYKAEITSLGQVIVRFGEYLISTAGDYTERISSIKSSATKLFNI